MLRTQLLLNYTLEDHGAVLDVERITIKLITKHGWVIAYYGTIPTCPQPNSLNLINVGSDSATLTWSTFATDSLWNTYITPSGVSPNNSHLIVSNNDTRFLWNGPKNWLLVSKKKELIKNILDKFKDTDFAVTDLSHSRAIIEIEGQDVKEVLKKGCPFNFDSLEKNKSINSTYNGITLTIDMLDDNPNKVRLFALRSFGESLYHSITDASLEYGFKSV